MEASHLGVLTKYPWGWLNPYVEKSKTEYVRLFKHEPARNWLTARNYR